MEKKTRVLICDDSSVLRRILSTVMTEDAELEVVYQARHGKDALDNFDRVKPDVVVLDVEMPIMDGIETAAAIRKRNATIPIVMFSSLTSGGAEATLDAINAGASDFATKPSGVGQVDRAIAIVKQDLVKKIKALAPRRSPANWTRKNVSPVMATSQRESKSPVEAVAIGVSTGGPKALDVVFSQLPEVPVPIFIVQHMPPVFTGQLADRLNSVCSMPVREAVPDAVVRPGEVWLAPGDFHMEIARDGVEVQVKLNQHAPEHSVRPAVDPLFRSVANYYRAGTLGVVLTGMGKDGVEGCRAIQQMGGQVLVQDQATSAVWGMPYQVVEAGLADSVAPLEKISREIAWRARRLPAPVS